MQLRGNTIGLALLGLALMPALGCVVAADALAPGLLSAFGLDANALGGDAGKIIVAVTNNTPYPANFVAFEADDINNLGAGTKNFYFPVVAGGNRNEVLDCPVGAITLGSVDAALMVDTTAVVLNVDGMAEEVDYPGSSLIGGRDFFCGDLINVFINIDAAGEAFITVTVTPGQ